MKKSLLVRSIALLSACAMMFLGMSDGILKTSADSLPYDTYAYDYREDIVMTPAAYVPDGNVTGLTLGIDNFKEPQDICKAQNGEIYVADTGNNRIVVLNSKLTKVNRIIDGFDRNGTWDTFNKPYGVCVSQNNELYVADCMNSRVVVLTPEGAFLRIIDNPESEILDDNFAFNPLKVTVDYADRVYVIGKNAFEGILVFESNGEFTGYFGTIEVKITLWEKFWRRLASKEKRSHSMLYIPTEFTGIDIDSDGFVYASNIDSEGIQAVRRLNPQGKDVIQKGENGNVGGDLQQGVYGIYGGPSQIVDVVYRGSGMYSILDRIRGRIFTYDKEGNLLYIFGGIGTQEGTFLTPIAIEDIDTHILVLDAGRSSIIKFRETNYGELINDAVALRYEGDETQAISKWQEVLKLDENNELANTGIGKAYLTAGDNVNAMKYLKIGMNRKYYSIAIKRYRNDILAQNLGIVLTVLLVLVIGFIVWKKIDNKKKGKVEDESMEGGME